MRHRLRLRPDMGRKVHRGTAKQNAELPPSSSIAPREMKSNAAMPLIDNSGTVVQIGQSLECVCDALGAKLGG